MLREQRDTFFNEGYQEAVGKAISYTTDKIGQVIRIAKGDSIYNASIMLKDGFMTKATNIWAKDTIRKYNKRKG